VEIQTLKNNIYKKDEALEKADGDLADMREQARAQTCCCLLLA
jgi:hypothetical protein